MKRLVFFFSFCLLTFSMLNGVKFFPFANGRSYPWTQVSLRSVFILNTSNVWAVGSSGTILRWQGLAWRPVTGLTEAWLQSVYMNNETDGWAVGQSTIIHWNGTFWETAPNPTGEDLYDIFMANQNDGWAVGQDGNTIRWNGTTWSAISSPTPELLFSVYIADSSDVWAVGSRGTIINWNGTAWNNVTSPITTSLYDVSMVTGNDGWGVGSDGAIIHYNGTSWSNITSPTTNGLRSVFMVNSTEGWAVGDAGTVIRWNGTAWNSAASPTTGWFFSVFMIDENDGWAVGDFGAIIQWNGVEWLESSTSIHQGDLIINGDDVFVIEDERFDINGSLIVEDNGTLILRNAVINFTQVENYQFQMILQNPASGNPSLLSENTTITSTQNHWFLVSLFDNSTATISNTTITGYLNIQDSAIAFVSGSGIRFLTVSKSAFLSVFNCTVSYTLSTSYSPTVLISNSTIAKLNLDLDTVNCSVGNFGPGLFPFWNFALNCSATVSPAGYAPNITIIHSTISSWQLSIEGKSNATLTNSTLGTLFSYDNTTIWMVNSTALNIQYHLKGKIYVSWYLDVHVTDSIGQDVLLTNVTAYYPNASLSESKLTDVDGWTRLTLLEKMMNATGNYPIGNYTLEATYEVYSNETTVNMTGNLQATLILESFIIPEFSSIIILPLFMTLTLLVAFLYNRRRFQ